MKIGGGHGQSKERRGTKKTPSRQKQEESKNQKYFRPISHSDASSSSSRDELSPFIIPSDFEEYARTPTPPINIPKKKNPKVALEEAVYKDEMKFQGALRKAGDKLRKQAEDRERRERYQRDYQRDYAAKKIQKITRGNQSRKNNKPLIDELKWEKDMEKKMKQLLREKKKKAWMERIKKRSKIGTQQLVGGRKRKTRRKKRKRKRTRRKGRRGVRGSPPILSIFKEGRGIKKTPRRRGNSNYTQKHKPSPRVRTAFHKSNR